MSKPCIIGVDVRETCRGLELEALTGRKPGPLPGGQRVALARATARRPSAFAMDDPLSDLDAKLGGQARLEIAALHPKLGVTFVYVTHDQDEAMMFAPGF